MSLRDVFTKNLKFYRKKMCYSQQQLAERCNIATNYLSEIERGQKFPSVEIIEHISNELKIPPYLLFIDSKTAVNNNMLTKKRNAEFSEKLFSEISNLLKEYGLSEI